MKLALSAAALIAGLSLAAAAAAQAQTQAQTQAQPPADPGFETRLALAHQVVEVSGGAAQAEAGVHSMYAGINRLLSNLQGMSPQATKIMTSMQAHVEQKLVQAIPTILDQSAQVYARNLTEKELRDEIVWLESDSGKSIRAKTPVILDQIMQAQTPMLRAMLPELMKKAADEACEESHCTASDQKLIEAMMTKMFPGQAPATANP
jgi:hypothetical protein